MRFEKIFHIKVDDHGRDFEIAVDFTVIDRAVEVTKTEARRVWPSGGLGNQFNGDWFWEVCFDEQIREFDKEALEEWDRAHGLVLQKVTA